MKLRSLVMILSSFLVLPLAAQVDPKNSVPDAAEGSQEQEVGTSEQESHPALRVFTNSATANYLPKYADASGTLTDSMISEVDGKIAIGATGFAPAEFIHVFTNVDANSVLQLENFSNTSNANAALRAKADLAQTALVSHATQRQVTRYGQQLGGWSELLTYLANGLAIGTIDAAPVIIGTNNVDRIHLTTDGKIGIGTPAPANALHVLTSDGAPNVPLKVETNGPDSITGLSLKNDARTWNIRVDGTDGDKLTFFDAAAGTRMTIDTSGRVGIGTTAPGAPLHIYGEPTGDAFAVMGTDATNGPAMNVGMAGASFGRSAAFINVRPDAQAVPPNPSLRLMTANVERMIITNIGRIGIGTMTPTEILDVAGNIHATGDIRADGIIHAKYQDVAEWVPSTADLAPATVVVLDPSLGNGVMASSRAYDTSVAGVVSAQPGIVLGEQGPSKEQIATTGRVRVRVDASRGAIAVGDLLVTSDKPGMAMRSEPMDMGGRKFHQPGTIVGKALESLNEGQGEILVLLTLQ